MKIEDPGQGNGPIVVQYNDYEEESKTCVPKNLKLTRHCADGANLCGKVYRCR